MHLFLRLPEQFIFVAQAYRKLHKVTHPHKIPHPHGIRHPGDNFGRIFATIDSPPGLHKIPHPGDNFSYAACIHGAPPFYHRGHRTSAPWAHNTTPCAGGTPRVETSKNMNVEGEQNASASAPDSPTTASTTAVQQAPQITSFFQLERTPPTQATPATSPPAAAADLPAAAAAGTNMTAPASPHQQRLNSIRSVSVSPPKHDLWVFGGYHTPCFITPPHLSHPQTHPVGVRTCYYTPWFITPPNTPCGCSDVLSHPLDYHTPLWAPCELHFITRGTQDITPPTGYHTG